MVREGAVVDLAQRVLEIGEVREPEVRGGLPPEGFEGFRLLVRLAPRRLDLLGGQGALSDVRLTMIGVSIYFIQP